MVTPWSDNFTPVVPVDEIVHSDEKPFCDDPTCDCHEDELAIAAVNRTVQEGLLTPDEATDFIMLGKLLWR